ncbi:HNH endonuclease, partial [Nocardioides zeae]
MSGELDLADARDLEDAVARGAARLAALGSGESLDVRRSIAVGELARKQTALDLTGQAQASSVAASTVAARQVVLYVHLSQAALASSSIGIDPLTGGTGIDLATVTAPGIALRTVTAEQVRDWCRTDSTQIVVKPVIDLNEHITTPSYRIPQRLVEQVQLRHPTCRFPYCNRPARVSDLDHRVEWHSGGRTASDNLVPLCRLHHRAKTHPTHAGTDPPDTAHREHERRWRYRPTHPDEPPDGFIWTSP